MRSFTFASIVTRCSKTRVSFKSTRVHPMKNQIQGPVVLQESAPVAQALDTSDAEGDGEVPDISMSK